MDTGYDFVRPEFLNVLFFQQKSLVIFPYVDLKHLRALDIFTAGHQVSELESTAIYDITSLLECQLGDSYSQTPSLYLIYNIKREALKDIMSMEQSLRCIVNTNDNVSELVNGSDFVFYNKKSKKFLNYENGSLEFEKHLISSSKNLGVLRDEIHKIKSLATRIFAEFAEKGNLDDASEILEGIEPKYWPKIVKLAELYHDVSLPEIKQKRQEKQVKTLEKKSKPLAQETSRIPKKASNGFFEREFEFVKAKNKKIATEFMQVLLDYRLKHVNPSNLEIMELLSPESLYVYLRNHHWEKTLPKEVLIDWLGMHHSNVILTKDDYDDFEAIFQELGIPDEITSTLFLDGEDELEKAIEQVSKKKPRQKKVIKSTKITPKKRPQKTSKTPSPRDFKRFKTWVNDALTTIERILTVKSILKDAENALESRNYGD